MFSLNIKSYLFLILGVIFFSTVSAQKFSAQTKYSWDSWQQNQWGYIYSDGWCYAVKGEQYSYTDYGFMSTSIVYSIRPVGNARDFYFRFKYSDLKLQELSKKEWKTIKKNGGWIKNRYCTFEYYVSDQYPTLQSALTAHSWPCAKAYLDPRKPAVLKHAVALTSIYYTDDDEVRTLNFWIDGYGFAITVHWDYSGNHMTYQY